MSMHFSTDDVDNLTVVDVYDVAASLGRDFETIINTYGVSCIAELMPKIINVLEQLEVLVSRNQKDNAEIAELKYSVERLHTEKRTKAEDRQKYEKEIEQIEEQWRAEVRLLEAEVAKLQEDGRRLRLSLQQQEQAEAGDSAAEAAREDELNKQVAELKSISREQKDRIRSLQRELKQRNVDVETLERQLQHLAQVNADYRRRTSTSHRYSEQLAADKQMLEDRLYDKEQLIADMKMKLLDKDDRSSPDSQLSDEEERSSKKQAQAAPDGDVTIDDLKEMLEQRNDIRLKLLEVEEELKNARPKSLDCEDVFELPVQGPINREPEEKLFPDRASGIRKFFRSLVKSK